MRERSWLNSQLRFTYSISEFQAIDSASEADSHVAVSECITIFTNDTIANEETA